MQLVKRSRGIKHKRMYKSKTARKIGTENKKCDESKI